MTCPPNSVQTKLEELASCLCAAVKADDLGDLCFCGLLPGAQIALDYAGPCKGACGMAWVRLVNFYPSTVMGQPSQSAGNCSNMLGLEVELGIGRCASVLDEEGNPPSAGDLLNDTQVQIADALAMRRAVLCCLAPLDFMIIAYAPFGPEGGMVGGTLNIALQVP